MNVMGFVGLILGLFVLIYLKCFRQINALLASLCSIIIIAIFNVLPLWDTVAGVFAGRIGEWTSDFLLVFVFGAIYGKSLHETGTAQAIGEFLTDKLGIKHTGAVIHILSLGLVFAGVDSLIALLIVSPVSIAMVRKANLPRRFAIVCFLGGGCSYVFGLPGSAAINNIIAVDVLGTTTLAAWLPGLLGSIVAMILILLYQHFLEVRLRSKGMGFDVGNDADADFGCCSKDELPSPWPGLISLLVVICVSVIPGGLNILPAKAAICAGLALSTVIILVSGRKYLKTTIPGVIESGVTEGIICTILTGAMLGFVAVVQNTGSFDVFAGWVGGMKMPPLLSTILSVQSMNVILANCPGTISVFLDNFSSQMLAAGITPAVLHRILAMSSISFAVMLPHNPGSAVLANTYKVPYMKSFKDIMVICTLAPLIGTMTAFGLISIGIM